MSKKITEKDKRRRNRLRRYRGSRLPKGITSIAKGGRPSEVQVSAKADAAPTEVEILKKEVGAA